MITDKEYIRRMPIPPPPEEEEDENPEEDGGDGGDVNGIPNQLPGGGGRY